MEAQPPQSPPTATGPSLAPKIEALHDVIDRYESVAVAFSAGVDSTLVLKVCRDRLGERAVAVVGVSPSLPPGELDEARALARDIGVRLVEIETSELDDARYRSNPSNRCYFCKTELYRQVIPYAREQGFRVVVDGLNADDLQDIRPGNQAAEESGVHHPLLDAGFGKRDVRQYARELGLANWDKPSLACLSSRVPHGTAIDPPLLERIGAAELRLKSLGLRQIRLRYHGEVARLEVAAEEMDRAFALRAEILRRVRESGFRFVALDLEGYRSGSLNP